VSEVVIGESLNFKQEPNQIMAQIKAFAHELQKKSQLPVHFEPEFFTSAEAEHIQGKTDKHDASAAALILKSYLGRSSEPKSDHRSEGKESATDVVSNDTAPKKAASKPMIKFEDFNKIEVTVGKVVSAEKIPETDKLLKLMVDFGEEKLRQIISGISKYYPNEKEELVGRKCMFITNLEPRTIRGYESQGMLFALSTEEGQFSLLTPTPDIPQGTRAK
jgi:methionine--tRNA ligase beta chain